MSDPQTGADPRTGDADERLEVTADLSGPERLMLRLVSEADADEVLEYEFPLGAIEVVSSALASTLGLTVSAIPDTVLSADALASAAADARAEVLRQWLDAERERVQQLLNKL